MLESCGSIQAFSCEYCEIFKNAYFEEHLRAVASVALYFFCWIITVLKLRFPLLDFNSYFIFLKGHGELKKMVVEGK